MLSAAVIDYHLGFKFTSLHALILQALEKIWNNAQCAVANDQKYLSVPDANQFVDSLTQAVQWYWYER